MEPYEFDEFEYVYDYAYDNFPSVDYEGMYIDFSKAFTFINRYNENKIKINFKYEDYQNNTDIQSTLKAFGIDVEKFWYLIIFIYDYSYGTCFKGISFEDSPKKLLDKLGAEIDNNIKDINERPLKVTFDKPMKLVLDIKGKHKFVIDDPTALYVLSILCSDFTNKINPNNSLNFSTAKLRDDNGNWLYESTSNSAFIAHVAKMFITFFDKNPQFVGKRENGSKVSLSKLLLISRMIYFIRLTNNKNFYELEDTLKGFIKQYKDYDWNFNAIYG